MNHQKVYSILFTVFSLLFTLSCFAQPGSQRRKKLQVGVAGTPPFVVNIQEQTGISLEIWQAMSNKDGLNYQLIPFDDVPEAMAALDSGNLDAVAGPVSITSKRMKYAGFTQPYFMTSLSIMSRTNPPTIWQRLKPFFSLHFFYAVFIFLCILGIVGTLLWLAERGKNPDEFPHSPARGIANGMWCAIVTMSTTGYGDRSPRTLWGRVLAGSWMVISIIFATTMVAGIASTLTLSGFNTDTITKAEQLEGKKTAVIKSSPAAHLVEKYLGEEVYVENLKEAYDLLKAKKVVAIVYDRAQLLYFAKNHEDKNTAVSVFEYQRQGYGFAVRPGSPVLPALNESLLELQESGRISNILNAWIGVNNKP